MSFIKRHIPLVCEAIGLAVLLLFALVLEGGFAVSLSGPFYLVMVVLGVFVAFPGVLSSPRGLGTGLFLFFCLGLSSLHFLTLTPVKPFKQFHGAITNGMEVQEVQRLLSRRFPQSGKFRRPALSLGVGIPYDPQYGVAATAIPTQSFHYILGPRPDPFDAETVTVYFKNDKVVGTQYLPD